ncbi:MAG TPA: hypothetical protein VNN17_05995 [Terriglobia bacterium]|nr:hypothetical protein [Terriglobia bacterium]
MTTRRAILFLFSCWMAGWLPASAQDDFLTQGEVDMVRDAQEPDKRMILWMDLAQRRIDSVKQALASFKPEAGRAIRKALTEYIRIMESLDSTIEDARQRRVPLSKGLRDVETRGNLYLNYLRTLESDKIPGFEDFKYTLEEALAMTRDELEQVAKGNYPEVIDRRPPTDLPPPAQRPPSRSQPAPHEGQEEGPPRKSQQNR